MKSAQNAQNTQGVQEPAAPHTGRTPAKKSFTSAEALALINSLRGEAAKYGHGDNWINHSVLVGDCAGKIATAIREHQLASRETHSTKGQNPSTTAFKNNQTAVSQNQAITQPTNHFDPDHARALGYLHDVGKGLGPFFDHPLTGYHYLKSRGYADEYASVCLTHSFTNRECEMISGYRPADAFLQDYIKTHENTLYEDIAALCDLYCNDQVLPLEGRLIDVIIRYGSSDRTAHRLEEIYRLKAKIEQRMGKSVEEVLGLPHFHPLLQRGKRKTAPES